MSDILLFGYPIDVIALVLSVISIGFVFLKEFFLPWLNSPKLEISYKDENPYRKIANIIHSGKLAEDNEFFVPRGGYTQGTFVRFRVKNTGKIPALNCRCQIYSIKSEDGTKCDFEGFPLKWASRPETVLDPIKAERLNLGRNESEFIDVLTVQDSSENIFFEKYHKVPIGLPNMLPPGRYQLVVLISGDNFKPYYVEIEISKENNKDIEKLDLNNFRVRR